MTTPTAALLFVLLVPGLGQGTQPTQATKQAPQQKAASAEEATPPLVPLSLPWIEGASRDKPTQPRIAVEVHADGSVQIAGAAPIEADDPELWSAAKAALDAGTAAWGTDRVGLFTIRKGRVLIRCDASAPFSAAQQVMTLGATLESKLPGYDFACRDFREAEAALESGAAIPGPTARLASVIPHDLPMHVGIRSADGDDQPAELDRQLIVALRVIASGERIDPLTQKPWSAELGRSFGYSDKRRVVYSIGPRTFDSYESVEQQLVKMAARHRKSHPESPVTARIEAARGVTYGEAMALHQALKHKAKVEQVVFTGAVD